MKQVPAIVHGDFKLFERYTSQFCLVCLTTVPLNLLTNEANKLFYIVSGLLTLFVIGLVIQNSTFLSYS